MSDIGPREIIELRSMESLSNSEAAQICDEGDYSSIIILQDDGIHAILRYTHQD